MPESGDIFFRVFRREEERGFAGASGKLVAAGGVVFQIENPLRNGGNTVRRKDFADGVFADECRQFRVLAGQAEQGRADGERGIGFAGNADLRGIDFERDHADVGRRERVRKQFVGLIREQADVFDAGFFDALADQFLFPAFADNDKLDILVRLQSCRNIDKFVHRMCVADVAGVHDDKFVGDALFTQETVFGFRERFEKIGVGPIGNDDDFFARHIGFQGFGEAFADCENFFRARERLAVQPLPGTYERVLGGKRLGMDERIRPDVPDEQGKFIF